MDPRDLRVTSPMRKATANRKSNPVRETAGKSIVRVGLIHSKPIWRLRTLKKSANSPPRSGLTPAPALPAREAAVRYEVAWACGAIFILIVVLAMLIPALAIPTRTWRMTRSGTVSV